LTGWVIQGSHDATGFQPARSSFPRSRGRVARGHTNGRKPYNIRMPIPPEIKAQKYISLATFRKNGIAVQTPVWFGEKNDKLYIVTRADSGKYKRIRNNPQVRVASCTIRGKITGPEFAATARILPSEDWPMAQKTVSKKYWLSRLNFFSRHKNVYLEIEVVR
jgi:PPOX class probable F420-dependent enzyme